MAKVRRLQNPPIAEALIDVQFQSESPLSDEEFLAFVSAVQPEGWTKQSLKSFEATIGPMDGGETPPLAHAKSTFDGCVLRAPDSGEVVQYRKNRLTVSITKGYQSWEGLADMFRRAYSAVIEHLKPGHVSRIATRYINRLEFSEELPVIEEYLVDPPIVAGFAKETYLSFRQQVAIADVREFTVVLNVGSFPGANGSSHGFVVDVDVFKSGTFTTDADALLEQLSVARSVKNDVFFSAVHEKALEKYQ